MDLSKVKELIKGLITDSTSTEDLEKIGAINQELNNAEEEINGVLTSFEDLRRKYIEVVKDTSFNEKPKEADDKPKTLEECIEEEIAKRKD